MTIKLSLYESVILTRLSNNITTPIHELQGGFQEGMATVMTSFLMKECVKFSSENNSKLFVCHLDVSMAFDGVWHDGLFHKLYHMGITGHLWLTVIELHTNSYRRVVYNSHESDWFVKTRLKTGVYMLAHALFMLHKCSHTGTS